LNSPYLKQKKGGYALYYLRANPPKTRLSKMANCLSFRALAPFHLLLSKNVHHKKSPNASQPWGFLDNLSVNHHLVVYTFKAFPKKVIDSQSSLFQRDFL